MTFLVWPLLIANLVLAAAFAFGAWLKRDSFDRRDWITIGGMAALCFSNAVTDLAFLFA